MSIKNDIDMVRDELNSEEKFFEKAVMTEKFVNKYKKPLIGVFVAIVLLVSVNIFYDSYKQNKIESANNVFEKLQENPEDSASLAELKSLSPNLHDVWLLSISAAKSDLEKLESLQNSNAELVKDMAAYELAQSSNDLAKLDSYSIKEEAIFKELAIVQSAVILIEENKIELAHEKLSQIPIGSSLSNIAVALLHYGVK